MIIFLVNASQFSVKYFKTYNELLKLNKNRSLSTMLQLTVNY